MNWFPGILQIIDLNIFSVLQSLRVIILMLRLSHFSSVGAYLSWHLSPFVFVLFIWQ